MISRVSVRSFSPANLILLIARLLVLVIAGKYQKENLLNTFITVDIDLNVKYKKDIHLNFIAHGDSYQNVWFTFLSLFISFLRRS